jgi:hypothetical protein
MFCVQHCFIGRPSDSTVSVDAGIEPGTVATLASAVRRSNHAARSHPYFYCLSILFFNQQLHFSRERSLQINSICLRKVAQSPPPPPPPPPADQRWGKKGRGKDKREKVYFWHTCKSTCIPFRTHSPIPPPRRLLEDYFTVTSLSIIIVDLLIFIFYFWFRLSLN